MQQRVEVKESQILTDGSMAADVASTPVIIVNYPKATAMINYSIQAVWSAGATPVGSLKLQATNDGTNWVDIACSSTEVTGNTGSVMYAIAAHSYDQVRLYYTWTSGSATLNAYFKGISYGI